MNIKQFLKPTWRKIVIFVILSFIFSIYSIHTGIPDYEHIDYGLPLPWLIHQISSFAGVVDIWNIEWLFLFIDLVIWHLLSCLIVLIYDKVKKK